ncbi:hypothetical protein Tco_1021099 [Tanacetum coccineum]
MDSQSRENVFAASTAAMSSFVGIIWTSDRENIAKTSAMPHKASPGVNSLSGGKGSMQQKLQELMDIVKSLEDNEKRIEGFAQKDAPNMRGMDQREDLIAGDVEKSTEKRSDNTDGP